MLPGLPGQRHGQQDAELLPNATTELAFAYEVLVYAVDVDTLMRVKVMIELSQFPLRIFLRLTYQLPSVKVGNSGEPVRRSGNSQGDQLREARPLRQSWQTIGSCPTTERTLSWHVPAGAGNANGLT
jgi:hypothetical protein